LFRPSHESFVTSLTGESFILSLRTKKPNGLIYVCVNVLLPDGFRAHGKWVSFTQANLTEQKSSTFPVTHMEVHPKGGPLSFLAFYFYPSALVLDNPLGDVKANARAFDVAVKSLEHPEQLG